MRGLLGNIHQGNIQFRNAGVQCTAIAYYALAFVFFSSTVLDYYPCHFDSSTIDTIITEGNAVYENIRADNGFSDGHYLTYDELPYNLH